MRDIRTGKLQTPDQQEADENTAQPTCRCFRSQRNGCLRYCLRKKGENGHLQTSCPGEKDAFFGSVRYNDCYAELNFNNHPFIGRTEEGRFALCHNGVLCNDDELSKTENLPETPIQTDSYVAVQLIEKQGVLDFESIAQMSEKVMGSFVFTILRDDNTLYISKGDNPICLLHFKDLGLYIYSSTPEIMEEALKEDPLSRYGFEEIRIHDGEIIRIDKYGQLSRSRFTPRINYGFSYNRYWQRLDSLYDDDKEPDIPPDDLDLLYEMGYLDEDIEILTNDRELLRYCIEEARMLLYGYA